MKRLFASLALGSLALGFAGVANACSCLGYSSPEEQVEAIDFVFEGQVINVAKSKDRRNFWQWVRGDDDFRQTVTTFQVNRTLKGELPSNVAIVHLPSTQSAACGMDFTRGEPILVFAYRGTDGQYGSSLCTRPQFPTEAYMRFLGTDAAE